LNEQRRSAAKETWKTKKYNPHDLRNKGTKASRRQLTKSQAARKTARGQKKSSNFKAKKFAVKAC